MKKTLLTVAFLLMGLATYSQTLKLEQVSSLLDTWKSNKGKSTQGITSKLKGINPKWTLKSTTPISEDYTKTYYWFCTTTGEPQYLMMVIEEDEESYKYSVRYLFYEKDKFQSMESSLKQLYPGKFSVSTDLSKRESTLLVQTGPIDYILTAQDAEMKTGKTIRAFTVDIGTNYIDKK